MSPEEKIAAYRKFLAGKAQLAAPQGIDIDPGKVHPVLKPHQRDAVLWAVRGGRRALFESFGLGKAQPVDEPVLTPGGWRAIGDITVGDQVISADGKPTRVTGVYPQGQRPILTVTFTDGAQVRCDEDHLWTVAKDADVFHERPWRVLTTRQILDLGLREPCGKSPDRYAWRIPIVQPVAHPAASLPIDPYVLGVLLGDGSFRREGGPIFTTIDTEIAAEVKSRLPGRMRMVEFALGHNAQNYRLVVEGNTNWNKTNPYLAATKHWGLHGRLAHEKFIPPEYLTASIEQRLDLLCGLMDTDGFAAKDGTIQFGSSSPQLAADVTALVQSLGGTARQATKIPTYVHRGERRVGRTHFTLTLRLPNGTVPFLLPRKVERCRDRYYVPMRKIASIEAAGLAEAVCIAVENPSRLYVTRNYVVTHNTLQQLEIERLILGETGGRGLIVCPLGIRQEFARDARLLGLETTFIRSAAEASRDGIYLTNYETIRDGKLDPRGFDVVSLDEAAILRGFGGTKTFRELMRMYEGSAAFRFVATATPSPNEYIELLSYAAFLDILDVGQGKTRFFKRDSAHADRLTLHSHMEDEFWQWVSSWALFLQKPSDLGHDDAGYELPPLDIRWHEVESPMAPYFGEGQHKDGQGFMFRDASLGLTDAAREKRMSLPVRIERVMEIIEGGRERARSAAAADGAVQGIPAGVSAGLLPPHEGSEDSGAARSAAQVPEGIPAQEPESACAEEAGSRAEATVRADGGPVCRDAGTAGLGVRDLHPDAGRTGGGSRSLIGEGPGTSLPQVQRGDRATGGQPGPADEGSGVPDQFVVWCELNDEQRAVERALDAAGISYSSLYGNQPMEEREQLLDAWRRRETAVFLSKPSMYGAGVNLQQCHRMIFAGITYKFHEVIQGIHRIHRFLQEHPVQVDLVYTEGEKHVRSELERKWREHNELVAKMGEIIRGRDLARQAVASSLSRSAGVQRREVSGDGFRLVNNDAVEECAAMPDGGTDLIVTSIPFATQYEYTPSYNDFGHTEDNAHFWAQMDFLTPELFRVLAPGRMACIHVKDRIAPGGLTGLGFQTLQPFHAEAIQHYMRHGFAFMAQITVVTDVVRENNQTYRLGWTEQCKDGTKMGAGVPEYVLVFRKPPTDNSTSYADVPVTKSKRDYSRARWQTDAHGFWRSDGNRPLLPEEFDGVAHRDMFRKFRDHYLAGVYDYGEHVRIGEHLDDGGRLPSGFMLLQPPSWHPDVWTDVARMRTLNMLQERKGQQFHLCPLQFDIVDRLLDRYSMPGETVYDPFGGLMTVPYCAVKAGRCGTATELNTRYFADGAAYVRTAADEASAPTLFDLPDELPESA